MTSSPNRPGSTEITGAATTEVRTRIGIISDTHGLLRPAAAERLSDVEHILHAGDIGSPTIVDDLRKIAPVTAIRGNIDKGEWAASYPSDQSVSIAGRSIYILHDLNELNIDPASRGFDIVVFGHSHRAENRDRRRRAVYQSWKRWTAPIQAARHSRDGRFHRRYRAAADPPAYRVTCS